VEWNEELLKCFRDSLGLIKFPQRANAKIPTVTTTTKKHSFDIPLGLKCLLAAEDEV